MKTKNLIFDLGGVILDLDVENSIKSFAHIGMKHEMLTPDDYMKIDILNRLEVGNAGKEEFCDYIRQSITGSVDDDAICRAWCSILGKVNSEKLQILRGLRKEHKRFLLSNTNAIHWPVIVEIIEKVEGRSINEYFDGIYLSFEMNMQKPDPEIFKTLLKEENLIAAETTLFDDLESNCSGAELIGMHAVKMDRNAKWPQWLR